MVGVSQFFADLIKRTIDDSSPSSEQRDRSTVNFSVDTNDAPSGQDIGRVTFRFSQPVPSEDLGPGGRDVLGAVAEALDTGRTSIIQTIQSRLGLTTKLGRRLARGVVQVQLGTISNDNLESGAISTVSGRTVTETSLSNLLEIAARNYLTQDMQRSNAPLRYRTGRFVNSVEVDHVTLTEGTNPRVSVFYRYMTRPYAVFDPARSTRPELYNRPFPGARNPQTLIGTALQSAARDIIHSRFRINTQETIL